MTCTANLPNIPTQTAIPNEHHLASDIEDYIYNSEAKTLGITITANKRLKTERVKDPLFNKQNKFYNTKN